MDTLITIDGSSLPKLKGFSAGRRKLYKKAERNMKGELRSDFVGEFLKLELEFAPTTETEMSTLLDYFTQSSFDICWYNEDTDSMTTTEVYPSDFDNSLILKGDNALYDEFKIRLISTTKL